MFCSLVENTTAGLVKKSRCCQPKKNSTLFVNEKTKKRSSTRKKLNVVWSTRKKPLLGQPKKKCSSTQKKLNVACSVEASCVCYGARAGHTCVRASVCSSEPPCRCRRPASQVSFEIQLAKNEYGHPWWRLDIRPSIDCEMDEGDPSHPIIWFVVAPRLICLCSAIWVTITNMLRVIIAY